MNSPKPAPLANGKLGLAEQLRHLGGGVPVFDHFVFEELGQRSLDACQSFRDLAQQLGEVKCRLYIGPPSGLRVCGQGFF